MSVSAIDNTPLSQLILKDLGLKSPVALGGRIASLPASLPPGQGLIINSSVPDITALPPCPYEPRQVAILTSALTPLSQTQLAALGYHFVLDKDSGFERLCTETRRWQQGLDEPSQPGATASQASATAPTAADVQRWQMEIAALIDAKLLKVEGEIHAQLEQVVTRWLASSLEPRLSSQLADRLPGLVATALADELDRLSRQG